MAKTRVNKIDAARRQLEEADFLKAGAFALEQLKKP
jgi:hypothetical protein